MFDQYAATFKQIEEAQKQVDQLNQQLSIGTSSSSSSSSDPGQPLRNEIERLQSLILQFQSHLSRFEEEGELKQSQIDAKEEEMALLFSLGQEREIVVSEAPRRARARASPRIELQSSNDEISFWQFLSESNL